MSNKEESMRTNNRGEFLNLVTEDQAKEVEVLFSYHSPDPEDIKRYKAIRDSAKDFALTVLRNTPKGSDQSAALRKVSEAVMTANAALARYNARLGWGV